VLIEKNNYFLLFITFLQISNMSAQFVIKTNSFDACTNLSCTQNLADQLTVAIYKKYTTPIPPRFTCDGLNISPELSWQNFPANVQSFVLIMDDPDAIPVVGKIFIHWFVYDIPNNINNFPENVQLGQGIYINVKQLPNDFGLATYGGPCPPKSNGPHIYRFSLFALNVPNLNITQALNADQFKVVYKDDIISCARLTGVYKRLS